MSEKESQSPQILQASEEEVRQIISWQQERYHHLQSMSISLIGAVSTIIAVVVTAYSIFEAQVPTFVLIPPSTVTEAAATDLGVSVTSVEVFLSLNWLIAIVIAFAAVSMLLTSILGLLDIVTQKAPHHVLMSPQSLVIPKSSNDRAERTIGTNVQTYLEQMLRQNQIHISEIHENFVGNVVRVIGSTIITFSALYILILGSDGEIVSLALLNSAFIIPKPTQWILRKVYEVETMWSSEQNQRRSQGLIEELAVGDTQERWDLPRIKFWERVLFFLATVLSALALLSVLIPWTLTFA